MRLTDKVFGIDRCIGNDNGRNQRSTYDPDIFPYNWPIPDPDTHSTFPCGRPRDFRQAPWPRDTRVLPRAVIYPGISICEGILS